MKISETIKHFQAAGKTFCSFEYFPPKTESGLQNLYSRLDRMATVNPAFVDITWGAGGTTADLTLEMSKTIQSYFGVNVMMHLTCTNMHKDKISDVLGKALDYGIQNILALRGDPPENLSEWEKCEGGFSFAKDLVEFIKEQHGDKFCIGVAGYPEGHAEQPDDELGIMHLKEKVDAGADLIITQLFYDPDIFLKFRDNCRKAGINVPIIPGIMPIHNFSRFLRFAKFANVRIPNEIISSLENIKNNDDKVLKYGIEHGTKMCEHLIREGVEGIHFYTLNLESSVTEIINRLNLSNSAGTGRKLPWRQSSNDDRSSNEGVRPIYWSNRPVSYLTRTQSWDNFPNGRWGDSSSPTFGELTSYHIIRHASKSKQIAESRRKIWGEPKSTSDIANVFINFCSGKISSLPWCELPLALESSTIIESLTNLNQSGFLTINSQPAINGISSEDTTFGWGAKGGRIYQKAYLEFFTSQKNMKNLFAKVSKTEGYSIQAVNKNGDYSSNFKKNGAMAVTWGVFPEEEIAQPTIVDGNSFSIWKDEAFNLWMEDWASIYNAESVPYNLIKEIHDTYFLVNIVDHNYVNGDIFSIFSAH